MNVKFDLTGIMPLLMHADDVAAADTLTAWRKDAANKNRSQAGDDRSPAWTWQTYLYSDGQHVAMPAANLMVCLRQAATSMILKKQKTFKEISQSGLLIASEFCEFRVAGKRLAVSSVDAIREMNFAEQSAAVEKMGFRLWAKRAAISKAKHIRVRPRFDSWSVHGELAVLVPEIAFENLQEMFRLAGRVGIGDWRPGCRTPGPFGMFTTKLEKA